MRIGPDDVLRVARGLGPLREKVVLLGGAAVPFLTTDPGAPPARATDDADLIVEVVSVVAYETTLRDQLRDLGFREDMSEGAPICRWVFDGIKTDILPIDPTDIGFSGRWYPEAVANAVARDLPDRSSIRVISGPYFLATKVEAFRDRGKSDFVASHDLEDVIAIADGRREIVAEVNAAAAELRAYFKETLGPYLAMPAFRDALPGHLPGDAASQARLPIVLDRLERIAGLR